MSKYIKEEDACVRLWKMLRRLSDIIPMGKDAAGVAVRIIEDLPSADVEPVRHGHWEQDGHHIRCSECGTYFCITDREGDSFPINYCPCCGARMDGEEQENE